MTSSPMDSLLAWYEGLAPELKTDLAAIVSASLPKALIGDEREHLEPEEFVAAAREWIKGMPSRHFGTVVALAGVIDAFLETRDSKSDWEEGRGFWEFLRERHPEMAHLADQHLAELPMRSRRWMAAATDWKALRAGPLATANVYEWMRHQK